MVIQVHTRKRNNLLFNRMKSFIPDHITVKAHEGFNHYTDALWYLVHIITTADCDYVVNVDEDCFIYDWPKVEQLIEQMARDEVAYIGMPDCLEYCQHRNNSEYVMNPFFNVFHVEQCRKAVQNMVLYDLLVFNTSCNFHEPFNNFFIQLFNSVPAGSIKTFPHYDEITTDTGFALHSWYSREYGNLDEVTERIDAVYKEAKNRWHPEHS